MKQTKLSGDAELSRRRFLQNAAGATATLASLDVLAAADARGEPLRPAVPDVATPLPLSEVRLTAGPLWHAQQLNGAYLLALEPDRMLAFFQTRAGLVPKAKHYGGWEGDGRNLNGHFAGHYLSALSLMYAATSDMRFKQRADYVVEELKAVQSADGYIGALEGGHDRFAEIAQGNIRSGGFDLNGMWSPWYVQHKIFAGLRDAYRYTENRSALDVEIRFAAWVSAIVSKLDDARDQRMLATEFGGMNEVMADLAADTGDPQYLALSDRFQHRAVLGPLADHIDHLDGLHGNTQIPKLVGAATRHSLTGSAADGAAASFFFDAVARHHSFATGGHGKDEYFGPADALSDRVDGRTAESCNVYNMLKLSRKLFALQPDIKYAEFQERALFNHVLGSIAPDDGQTCYMVPVGQGVQREYQGMFTDFTCCVGSGMENHALHGFGIYYVARDRVYINLYVPSTAALSPTDQLTVDTTFPEGDSATLTLSLKEPKKLTLCLRRPSWAGDWFAITVNSKPVANLTGPGSYIEIDRSWSNGDVVAVSLPKALHLEPLPDNPNRAAILWGPLVLAGDLGPQRDDPRVAIPPTPVFVGASHNVADWLKAGDGQPGRFRSAGAGRDAADPTKIVDVDFVPFYRLHRRTYAVYNDIYTPSEWQKRSAAVAATQAKRQLLEAATIGFVHPGMMQSERDANFQGEDSRLDRVLDRPARRGKSWFSFDIPADPGQLVVLIVTYCTAEARKRSFTVSVDGETVGEQVVPGARPGSPAPKFFDVEYPLPADVTHGKKTVTVRFQAAKDSEIAAVFGIRTVRAGAER